VVRYTKDSTRTAVEDFESALRLDPNYALAHAGLAMASAIMRIRFASEAEYKAWEERAHGKLDEQSNWTMSWRKRTKPWQRFIVMQSLTGIVCSSRAGARWNSIQTSICHTFTEQLPSITWVNG